MVDRNHSFIKYLADAHEVVFSQRLLQGVDGGPVGFPVLCVFVPCRFSIGYQL